MVEEIKWLGAFKAALLSARESKPRRGKRLNLVSFVSRWSRRSKMDRRKRLNYLSGSYIELRNYARALAKVIAGDKKTKQRVCHSGNSAQAKGVYSRVFDMRTLLELVVFLGWSQKPISCIKILDLMGVATHCGRMAGEYSFI